MQPDAGVLWTSKKRPSSTSRGPLITSDGAESSSARSSPLKTPPRGAEAGEASGFTSGSEAQLVYSYLVYISPDTSQFEREVTSVNAKVLDDRSVCSRAFRNIHPKLRFECLTIAVHTSPSVA